MTGFPIKAGIGRRCLMVAVFALLVFSVLGAGKAYAVLSATPSAGYPNIYDVNGINGIAISGNAVYVGGRFANFDGQTRDDLAGFNLSTGEVLSWSPTSNQYPEMLKIIGSKLYIGGGFTTVGGDSHNGIARYDITNPESPTLDSWDPQVNGRVNDVYLSGSTLYLGGEFTTADGGTLRNRGAAVDVNTAALHEWNPNVSGGNNRIYQVVPYGSNLVLTGTFTSIGGTGRNHIGMVDMSTGAVQGWNPDAGQEVRRAVLFDSKLVVAGGFTTMGEQDRNRFAQIDLDTGNPTSWYPNPGSTAAAFELYDGKLMVGGSYTAISDTAREGLALVGSDANASVDSWNPNPVGDFGGAVGSLAVSGTTVVVGGSFTKFGFGPWLYAKGIAVFENVESPQANSSPTVAGNPAAGQTLTCSGGNFSYSKFNSNTYQWAEIEFGVPKAIWGASSSTYALPSGTSGKNFTCTKTATNIAGSGSATSDTVTVSSGTPLDSGSGNGGGTTTDTTSCKTRGKIVSKSVGRALSSGKIRMRVTTNKTGSTANIHLRAYGIRSKLAARQSVTFSNGLTTKRVTLKLRSRAKRELRRRVNKRKRSGQKKIAMRLRVYCFNGGKRTRTSTSQKMSVSKKKARSKKRSSSK